MRYRVASNPNNFHEAMNLNHFFCVAENEIEDEMLTEIYNGVKLPTTVNNDEVSGQHIAFEHYPLSPDDPYDISHLKFMLLKLWHHHILASERLQKSEYDLRSAIDTLMREAFDSNCRKYHGLTHDTSFRTEQELCLPAVPPGIAKADAVVWSQIPLPLELLFDFVPNHYVFSAEGSERHHMIATFAFEANVEDEDAARSQLCFDLCSAQHQRRAFGFTNHRIYGALLVESEYKLYCSKWIEERVRIYPTTISAFDLLQFPEFLKLFIFLCRLAEEIYTQVQEMKNEVQENEEGFKKRFMDAAQNPWRPREHFLGPDSGGKSHQDGSVDDSLGEGISDGMDLDNIQSDGREICHQHSYVKQLRSSPMEVKSWVNLTTEDLINAPE
ncbi:hypothetical protein AGABI2DRAFT_181742 [Agaricus bisporus var. bisporus H97]|uniref:hypothetical protein n=1 Tax=Agaricus bisporus var. bisporus (strain H97 / ATCC MYA-4626 / FGSC 10389) TaxID=936046 RepID=UPI00029F6595|nr:hypothetical protein AGABI2DRAFT_181742 [Agaricus bisporus var. bisporus H97]EKV41728.1 hypothetical protein AGABI2DRAFT_181742 [Agaricus bisporus var. bisporus H97]